MKNGIKIISGLILIRSVFWGVRRYEVSNDFFGYEGLFLINRISISDFTSRVAFKKMFVSKSLLEVYFSFCVF